MPLDEHLRRFIKGLTGEKVVLIQEKTDPDNRFTPRLIQDPVYRPEIYANSQKPTLYNRIRKTSYRLVRKLFV